MDENNRIPMDEFSKEDEIINETQADDENPEELDNQEASDNSEEPDEKGGYSKAKELYEWVSSIAIAVVLALVINQFFFALVQVDGQSMEPTLSHNERLIVRKILYTPEQEDIVIVKSEALQKYIVKRVVALPGQTVTFDDNRNLIVDGVVLDEPYIKEKQVSFGNLYTYPVVVPKKGEVAKFAYLMAEAQLKSGSGDMTLAIEDDGTIKVRGSELVEDGTFVDGQTTYKQDCYFVMGDNRNHSSDSRSLGLIPKSEVIGKSSLRLFPFDKFGFVE